MDRVLLALAIAAVAVGVAAVVQRRRPDAPAAGRVDFQAPSQLARGDFIRPESPWLVVVFTSSTCSTCSDVAEKAAVLESDDVAVQVVEANEHKDLHGRYQIEAVPITVIAGRDGAVQQSFMGPVSATHLWAAVADLREPGTVPPGCESHHDDPAG